MYEKWTIPIKLTGQTVTGEGIFLRNITPSRTEQICPQYSDSAYDLPGGVGGVGYRLPSVLTSFNTPLLNPLTRNLQPKDSLNWTLPLWDSAASLTGSSTPRSLL